MIVEIVILLIYSLSLAHLKAKRSKTRTVQYISFFWPCSGHQILDSVKKNHRANKNLLLEE